MEREEEELTEDWVWVNKQVEEKFVIKYRRIWSIWRGVLGAGPVTKTQDVGLE